MTAESKRRNALEHVPACSSWPPPWLTSSTPARIAAGPDMPEPPPDASPWDLSAELYAGWEERVCIMHFDGRLPWREAEALALADVLGQVPDNAAAPAPVGQPAPEVQGSLFPAVEWGPYQ